MGYGQETTVKGLSQNFMSSQRPAIRWAARAEARGSLPSFARTPVKRRTDGLLLTENEDRSILCDLV